MLIVTLPRVYNDGAIPIHVMASIKDRDSGKPIPGARVVLKSAQVNRDPNLYSPPKYASAETDLDGKASVWDHFPAGWGNFRGEVTLKGGTIEVSAAGYDSQVQPLSPKAEISFWTFARPVLKQTFLLSKHPEQPSKH